MMSTATNILPVTETVTPADEASVVAALRDASQKGIAVYPIGGGTSLGYGSRPTRPGIGLSTSMLKQVIDYSANDMTVTVEAGLPLGALRRLLLSQQQWLPIDVAEPDRATVGGILATNTYGPRRYAYGTIRDYVLGLRAVDGQGEVFAGGGRVVKNAAGYNIPRLMVGSFGTLGVITQVTLMVQAAPKTSAMVVGEVNDFEVAESLLAGLTCSQTLPVAIEMLAGPSLPGCSLPPMASDSVARIIVAYDGSPSEVQWMVGQLANEWEDFIDKPLTCTNRSEVDRLWAWLIGFPGDLQINVLPSETVPMIEEVTRLMPGCPIQAHAGNGVIRVQWSATCGSEDFAEILRSKLRPAVSSAGGSLVVLSYPESVTLDFLDIWGVPGEAASVMRTVQERFDPHGILNPGRFIFGNQ